jgi:hypothetical protein
MSRGEEQASKAYQFIEQKNPASIQAHQSFLTVFGNPATQTLDPWLSILRSHGVWFYRFKKLIFSRNLQSSLKPVNGYFRGEDCMETTRNLPNWGASGSDFS